MIRIPIGNEKSARIEVRAVAPDANPYLAILAILNAAYNPIESKSERLLPSNIYTSMDFFENSELMKKSLGENTHAKYIKWKRESANRCPKELGMSIKTSEIIYHHEVTNQQIWNMF